MSIPVVWLAPNEETPARGYWDQALLEDVFARVTWRPAGAFEFEHLDELDPNRGSVLVVPGASSDARHVGEVVRSLPWALVIVTSDEEHRFDIEAFHDAVGVHPFAVWSQYGHEDGYDLGIPVGYAPGTTHYQYDLAAEHDWVFIGQDTQPRRHQAVKVMRGMPRGRLETTAGFAQGIEHGEYLRALAQARTAPCPGGPCSPDTFRVWEAAEMGAVPIVDELAGADQRFPGFWHMLFAGFSLPPWAYGPNWSNLPAIVRRIVRDPMAKSKSVAWWIGYKRWLTFKLDATIAELAGIEPDRDSLRDLITVVIPTSPIASHPSTDVLSQTIASLDAVGLGDCDVLVTIDGVRPIQDHYAKAYAGYVGRVTNWAAHDGRLVPIVHREHQHQARMMRHALDQVHTPLVLYVEHDCPIEGPIDWWTLARHLLDDQAGDVVRFYHEADLQPEHRALCGPAEQRDDVTLIPTKQWSQRPHLARSDYYRQIMREEFAADERWMIEDRMHSVCETSLWDRHRLWIYAVDSGGDQRIRRSLHLDGRGSDEKWVDQ